MPNCNHVIFKAFSFVETLGALFEANISQNGGTFGMADQTVYLFSGFCCLNA